MSKGRVTDLSAGKLDEGIALCHENSFKLLADSKILLDNESHGHSIALALMAFEEVGKMIVLVAIKHGITKVDQGLEKLIFRDHLAKLAMTLEMLAVAQGHELNEEITDYVNKTVPKLQSLKERGIYADYFSHEWHSPLDKDLEKIARKLISETDRFMAEIDRWLVNFYPK